MLRSSPAPVVDLRALAGPAGLDPWALFGVARRINPRRSALFVSRVLGKHVPVDPAICVFAGLHLAWALDPPPSAVLSLAAGLADPRAARSTVESVLSSPPCQSHPLHVVGFAETATALGHVVRDGLEAVDYVHTTRQVEPGWEPVVTFREDHSHAVHHRIVHRDHDYLLDDHPVVFVDDELTTGHTILAAVAAIQARAPRSDYLVASFLDWRDGEARAAFAEAERRLHTTITVRSLVTGQVTLTGEPATAPPGRDPHTVGIERPLEIEHLVDFANSTGRHGWDVVDQAALTARVEATARVLESSRTGPRTLVLGTDEFMYAPLRVALSLGEGVAFQSTTRSPIVAANVEGYPIRHKTTFSNPAVAGLDSYVYNVAIGMYDDIFVFFERTYDEAQLRPLVDALSAVCPRTLQLVFANS